MRILTLDVLVWDIKASKKQGLFHQHQELVYSLAFSPDSSTISAASLDGTVRLWDIETGESRALSSQETGFFFAVRFLPSGGGLVAADSLGRILLLKDDLPHKPKDLLSALKEKVQELRGDQ